MDDIGQDEKQLLIRCHGNPDNETIIYLPGSHGDWSLIPALRNQLVQAGFRFIEFTYPRTTTWTIQQYSQAVAAALNEHGIAGGWLLAESFGSQIAWPLAHPRESDIESSFQCLGIILAGGFIRHPFPWGVSLFQNLCGRLLKQTCDTQRLVRSYFWWAKHFYEATSEKESSLIEFASHRNPKDALAAIHRLKLIRENDPRALAKKTAIPVYYLGGVWDPLVPWYLVCPWLRKHCPGFQKAKLLPNADHNVLFSRPTKIAQAIIKWLGRLI